MSQANGFENLMTDLVNVPGVRGAFLFSPEGTPQSYWAEDEQDAATNERFLRRLSQMLKRFGDAEDRIELRFADGRFIIHSLAPGKTLACLTEKKVNLPLLTLTLDELQEISAQDVQAGVEISRADITSAVLPAAPVAQKLQPAASAKTDQASVVESESAISAAEKIAPVPAAIDEELSSPATVQTLTQDVQDADAQEAETSSASSSDEEISEDPSVQMFATGKLKLPDEAQAELQQNVTSVRATETGEEEIEVSSATSEASDLSTGSEAQTSSHDVYFSPWARYHGEEAPADASLNSVTNSAAETVTEKSLDLFSGEPAQPADGVVDQAQQGISAHEVSIAEEETAASAEAPAALHNEVPMEASSEDVSAQAQDSLTAVAAAGAVNHQDLSEELSPDTATDVQAVEEDELEERTAAAMESADSIADVDLTMAAEANDAVQETTESAEAPAAEESVKLTGAVNSQVLMSVGRFGEMAAGLSDISLMAAGQLGRSVVASYWRQTRPAEWKNVFHVSMDATITANDADVPAMEDDIRLANKWAQDFLERCLLVVVDLPLSLMAPLNTQARALLSPGSEAEERWMILLQRIYLQQLMS